MTTPIQVFSEIGPLETVLMKRPGPELDNLTPDNMSALLFDELPFLAMAQKEHDHFAEILRQHQVEVLYLEDLVTTAMTTDKARKDLIAAFLAATVFDQATGRLLEEYLLSLDGEALVAATMAGIRRKTLGLPETEPSQPFVTAPMPSLYFTRDPASGIGEGMTLNPMAYPARQKENLYMASVLKDHPRFAGQVPCWLAGGSASLEGGDILVLSDNLLAIGLSQRTQQAAIQQLAKSLFKTSSFHQILVIEIPQQRSMMHLDTVLTMVDQDKFTYYPGIQQPDGGIPCYLLQEAGDGVKSRYSEDLKGLLAELLDLPEVLMIPTGGGDQVAAAREQWGDGSNTLALAPGVVVTYDRNQVTNETLRRHGVTVLEIPSGELSRGRGGPRCMTQPLRRKRLYKN